MAIRQLGGQQVEIGVAGPGDVNRLFICKGLADGGFGGAGFGGQSLDESWVFEVGPKLDSNQFRRAIVTTAVAGLEPAQSAFDVRWSIKQNSADFDDESGQVRVTVASRLYLIGNSTQVEQFLVSVMLSYDVAILAAVTTLP